MVNLKRAEHVVWASTVYENVMTTLTLASRIRGSSYGNLDGGNDGIIIGMDLGDIIMTGESTTIENIIMEKSITIIDKRDIKL
jgi:hypothetical protein